MSRNVSQKPCMVNDLKNTAVLFETGVMRVDTDGQLVE